MNNKDKQNNFINVKGFLDYNFKDMILLNYIFDNIRIELEKSGFNPFETPKIEFFKTLCDKNDEDNEILTEIFRLRDRGQRDIGLRFDLTVPMARFVSQNFKSIKFPFKRYQFGSVFRNGPIKKGRLREFIQFDFDIVGIEEILNEVECLSLYLKIYKKFEIDVRVEINNVKILNGVLKQIGFNENDFEKVLQSLDKLKKIGKENVIKEISNKNLDKKLSKKAIEILEENNLNTLKKFCNNDNEILKKGIEELEEIIDNLDKESGFEINLTLARGLNYYTGTIFEVFDKNDYIKSSIGGGGRYDNLIKNFSNGVYEKNCFGCSFGIIPIFEILKERKEKTKNCVSQILIVPLKKEFVKNCFLIKEKLNKENYNCDLSYFYNLKKAFSYCERYGIENICVIGEKEIKQKKVKIKNIIKGEENEFKL